ncbi:MarR family winged helix-turn-helix transcriptional regulator [Gordonia sp. CPCC 206044]|uniref:MarR family winged helix-turn-helix transcriptional regulator n=1 Tax=Gordonia sp. CPCC 206044 TaxID=3140793 RepID=UPI003AF351BD
MTAAGPGQLLFGFVRHWSRRATSDDAGVAEQGRLILVTEAVAALIERAEPATVNAVAEEVGVDQSGGSRLIKSAVQAGYLTMITGTADGRRREAAVTESGRVALRHAHAWQERMFDEMTVGWSQTRRDDFRAAMVDLIARSHEIGASRTGR